MYVLTTTKTYRCQNLMTFRKWDAMEMFSALEVGHTYHARVVGLRVGFLDWYPSILSADDLAKITLEPPPDITEFTRDDLARIGIVVPPAPADDFP